MPSTESRPGTHLSLISQALPVFGQIKHCRRKNGRGRIKYPRLKPPPNLQVGVVKKIRDNRGNLLKVSTKALFGKKKEIEKRIQRLGIGQKINTSHMEWLNGTIRGQQARLARRTRNGSHLEVMLQYSMWLWSVWTGPSSVTTCWNQPLMFIDEIKLYQYHEVVPKINKAYKEDEDWKHTNSFSIEDLPKIALVANEAYKYIRLKSTNFNE